MIAKLQLRLTDHPVYDRVRTSQDLRVFMEHHVVCVWDFMSLLKSLQRDIVGATYPWIPPSDPQSARLINEIVLDEESDMIDGQSISHFELYLAAMDEIGADTQPIRRTVAALAGGATMPEAVQVGGVPAACKRYLRESMALLDGPLWSRAAVFFFGREQVIPDMFSRIVDALQTHDIACRHLRVYLSRHIETDSERHGPLACRLAEITSAGDPTRQREAEAAAAAALTARLALWDAIAQRVHSPMATTQARSSYSPTTTRGSSTSAR